MLYVHYKDYALDVVTDLKNINWNELSNDRVQQWALVAAAFHSHRIGTPGKPRTTTGYLGLREINRAVKKNRRAEMKLLINVKNVSN
jgi:ribosomal protein L30/L7E